jgi:uncharacterized protein YlxP (DUF503 family)
MYIVNIQLILYLPYVNSLKGRRKYINSLKEKLSKHNLSILDISKEYIKEADIAICFLAKDSATISKKIQTIENIIEKNYPELEYELDYEVI